jgi:hypothetical protein
MAKAYENEISAEMKIKAKAKYRKCNIMKSIVSKKHEK